MHDFVFLRRAGLKNSTIATACAGVMYFLILGLFFRAAAVHGAASGQAENLLGNTGFEEGTSAPAAWTTFPPSTPGVTYAWDNTVSHGGSRSVSVESSGQAHGMWQQVVPVSPGAVYELSGYLNVEGVESPGRCNLQLVFRDGGNNVLEMVDYPEHRGTIEWIHDFPHAIYARAPGSAATVEVNLYLKGPGRAWFDDVYFGLAPTGVISGTVSCGGNPVYGARVFIWATDYEDYTDESGYYTISDVPVSAPRYLIYAARDGYRDTAQGDIDIIEGETTTVDLVMEEGSNYTYQELRVKFGSLRYRDDVPAATVPPDAVIDPGAYPEEVLPYLLPSEYIDSDHPLIQGAAGDILDSLNPAERTDTRAVSYAVYLWIIKNYECDAISGTGDFNDTTCGGWQTVSGEGWCWGHNFTDWLYRPSEMFGEHRGICIEHSRFVTALLRAAGIPARPVRGYGAQFWALAPGGEGCWVGICTMVGRGRYRTSGNLYSGYECYSPSEIFNYPIDEGPIIHSDWHTDNKCMWREVHPWPESYEDSTAGFDRAAADLAIFEETGEAPDSHSPGPGPKYVIHYSDFTLNLTTIGEQRMLTARFPIPVENEHVTYLDRCAYWTDHPECVTRTWMEEISNPPVPETCRWFNIEFDITQLVSIPREATSLAVMNEQGEDCNLFVYNAPAGGDWTYWDALSRNPSALARDLWIVPSGNNTRAMTELIVPGTEARGLGVLRVDGGFDQNLYLYYVPAVGDWTYWDSVSRNPSAAARDLWAIPSGNDTVLMADTDDCLAVMRDDGGDYGLFLYNIPRAGDRMYWDAVSRNPSPVARDLWVIPSANDAVAMCGLDTTGDGDPDSLVVVRDSYGECRVYLWNMPVPGDWTYEDALARNLAPVAFDEWVIPQRGGIEFVTGVNSVAGFDELCVMENDGGDYNMYIWNAPRPGDSTEARALARNPSPLARDFWQIPIGNDTVGLTGLAME